MRVVLITLLSFLLLPGMAGAAGFAKDALFLSKTPVTEGETVIIHTVVANEKTAKFEGEVVFADGGAKIGAVAVSIAPGGANTVSVSWKPAAGSHIVSADLTNKDGTIAEQKSATFSIAAKPKPVATSTNANASSPDSSTGIQQAIANVSPAAADAAVPVFKILDSGRTKATQLLDQGIAWAKKQAAKKPAGSVLGAQTSTSSGSLGIVDTIWSVIATVLLFVFSILRFFFSSAAAFYPIFALAFLYILWRIYKRMRRPKIPN